MNLNKFFILIAAVAVTSFTGCKSSSSADTSVQKTFSRDLFAMDTYMSVRSYGGDESALDSAESCIRDLENKLSATISGSDVSSINSGGGKPVDVSDDTAAILRKAVETGKITGGALDVTAYPLVMEWGFTTGSYKIPSQERIDSLLTCVDYRKIVLNGNTVTLPDGMLLDLGALAKGYTGDKVIETLRKNGADAAIISLGGNVQAFGEKPDGSAWKVAVRDPFTPENDMCTIEIGEKAVITSGNYERCFTGDDGKVYWHIIDPADGFPADNGIVSATIIGDDGLTCDALSTAMFVEGLEGACELWKNDRSYDMILVTDDSRIFYTEGIADSFTNLTSMPAEVIPVD